MNYRVYINDVLAVTFETKSEECDLKITKNVTVAAVRTSGEFQEVNLTLSDTIRNAPAQGMKLALDEIEMIRMNKPIIAIKMARQRLGISLKDAKDLVDAERTKL